jgi:hypothetical protein
MARSVLAWGVGFGAGLLLCFARGDARAASPGPASGVLPSERLTGDIGCEFGAADCNRCVRGVRAAVRALHAEPTAVVRYSSMAARRLPPYGARLASFAGNDSHLEGIARLPALGDSSWMVVSRARPGSLGGGGFFLVHLGDVPDNHGAPFGSARMPVHYINSNPVDRRTGYYHPVARGDHPGGLQLLGQTLALTVSCASAKTCDGDAFVQFDDLRQPSARQTMLERVALFQQGEPHAALHATSVAVAKQADGRYLMFVQGKDDKREGWFYRSDRASIGPNTRWTFVDYFRGGSTWNGAYQSTTLMTECDTGQLYLLGAGNPGYRATLRPRFSPAFFGDLLSLFVEGGIDEGAELLHLWKLEARAGHIAMDRVFTSRWKPDSDAYCSFRAGASAYVTPDGRLALYCTTRKANTDLLGSPDSKLKLLEFQ